MGFKLIAIFFTLKVPLLRESLSRPSFGKRRGVSFCGFDMKIPKPSTNADSFVNNLVHQSQNIAPQHSPC